MPSVGRSTGPSALELMVGGDTYKGVYVPPLAAQVMKEMEAEAAAKKRAATDTYVAPKKAAPAPKALSAETTARLAAVAKAPDLDAALGLVREMPEIKAATAGKAQMVAIAELKVPDRDEKARSAASMLIIEGKDGSARYFGSDLTLFADESGRIASRLDKLFGYSNWQSNRFGIQYERSDKTVRSGIARFLPGSTTTADLARFVPEFTPAGLADAVRAFLQKP